MFTMAKLPNDDESGAYVYVGWDESPFEDGGRFVFAVRL